MICGIGPQNQERTDNNIPKIKLKEKIILGKYEEGGFDSLNNLVSTYNSKAFSFDNKDKPTKIELKKLEYSTLSNQNCFPRVSYPKNPAAQKIINKFTVKKLFDLQFEAIKRIIIEGNYNKIRYPAMKGKDTIYLEDFHESTSKHVLKYLDREINKLGKKSSSKPTEKTPTSPRNLHLNKVNLQKNHYIYLNLEVNIVTVLHLNKSVWKTLAKNKKKKLKQVITGKKDHV